MSESERKEIFRIAKEVEYRIYEYLIVATLGILGFSIEQFDAQRTPHFVWLVVASWLLLLLSTILGLNQVFWRIALDGTQWNLGRHRDQAEEMSKSPSMAGPAVELKKKVDDGQEWFKRNARRTELKSQIQLWSLALGVSALVLFKCLNVVLVIRNE